MRQLLIITVSQDVNIPRLIVQRQLDFWREHHAELLTTSNKRGSDEDKVLPQDYRSFFSLVSHREALSQKTLHPILVTASVLLRVLQMSGYLGESEEIVDERVRRDIHEDDERYQDDRVIVGSQKTER